MPPWTTPMTRAVLMRRGSQLVDAAPHRPPLRGAAERRRLPGLHQVAAVVGVATAEVDVAVGRHRLVIAGQHDPGDLVAGAVAAALLEDVGEALELGPGEEEQVAAGAG